MPDILKLPQIHAHIQRGSEAIPVHVPRHELRVLRAVHGPHNVREVGDSRYSVTLEANADAEFARLTRKYFSPNKPNAVLIAYPIGPSALEGFGFGLDRAPIDEEPQAEVIDHQLEAEAAAQAAAEAEDLAAVPADPLGDTVAAGKAAKPGK